MYRDFQPLIPNPENPLILKILIQTISPPPNPDYNYEYAGLMITFKTEFNKNTAEWLGKIFELIRKNNTITISELAEQIGVTVRSVERNIQQLQKIHLLQRIGRAKGGRWEVFLCLDRH